MVVFDAVRKLCGGVNPFVGENNEKSEKKLAEEIERQKRNESIR